ncbi:MAG: transporter substrate-binding domain-containing protein [Acetobacteraceae bacterium]
MQDDKVDATRRRGIALALTGMGGAALLPARAEAQSATDSRMDTVVKRGHLIVATSGSSPPLCYTDDQGKLIGFDIDIAKLIARGMFGDENKIDFQVVDSSGRWPAVLSGRVDFGIASTTIYPDRALRVGFTVPYMDSGMSILVTKDSGITTLAQLNDAKYTLANLSNPQMADRAKRVLPNTKLITFETASAMMLAVKSGQAVAMQMDTPVLQWYAANDKTLQVLSQPLGTLSNNALFLKPGDFTWWQYLSTVVVEMRTGSLYSDYTTIFNKWFGTNPPPQRFYAKV